MQSGVFRLLLLASLTTLGCDEVTVRAVVNAAHHGTRVDGKLPDLGDPEKPRVFTTDLGWTVTLSDGFVVTAAAQFETCDGTSVLVDTPFGPFPEYWSEQDKSATDFGYADLPEGTYCELILEYGRYRTDVAVMAEDTPFSIRDLEAVENRTVYLVGYAEKPDGLGGSVSHNFVLETDQTIQVRLDLTTINQDGAPFSITGDENSPPQITVLKVYDALFQGVDFDKLDIAAFNATIPARLTASTSIIRGASVY